MSETVKDTEMSQEELEERRKKVTEFYAGNIPHLQVQCEYEELLTKIEENRAKRLQAQMMIAQIMASQEENPANTKAREDFEQELENQRKLKKV
jgi:siroheme synthase (precorrin-2 oxidase/ferrochelatase)